MTQLQHLQNYIDNWKSYTWIKLQKLQMIATPHLLCEKKQNYQYMNDALFPFIYQKKIINNVNHRLDFVHVR